MRRAIGVFAWLLVVMPAPIDGVAAGSAQTPDAGQLIAERLPGQWTLDDEMGKPRRLDFHRNSRALLGVDTSTVWPAGAPVFLVGTLRDSRISESISTRDPFAVTPEKGQSLLVIFPQSRPDPPTTYVIELRAGAQRQDDVLVLAERGRGETREEYRRVPERLHTHHIPLAGPSDGIELTATVDQASDLHTVLEGRLVWKTDDAAFPKEHVWKQRFACTGVVSPDRKRLALGMTETNGLTGHTEIEIVDLETGKTTATGLATEGVSHVSSSILSGPSMEWAGETSLLFTTGRGETMDRRIVLCACDPESGKASEFVDDATSQTALLEPAHGHAFVRDDEGRLFFRVDHLDVRLYPLDAERQTVGQPLIISRDKRPNNWRVLTREWLEKAGAPRR